MACLYKRENKDGSVVYRVVFRRVGIPTFCTCFSSEEKAADFCKKWEVIYVSDYDRFMESMKDHHLIERRNREFNL